MSPQLRPTHDGHYDGGCDGGCDWDDHRDHLCDDHRDDHRVHLCTFPTNSSPRGERLRLQLDFLEYAVV